MKLLCTQCEHPVTRHCPDTNPVCAWVVCRNPRCTAHTYDLHRGLLRHTDGTIETWDDQPTTTQPPTVTVEDETDGRPATPDA